MIETAFNSQCPVLKAGLQKFHLKPQGILTTGCEQHMWNTTDKPGICLHHPPFSGRIKGCWQSHTE